MKVFLLGLVLVLVLVGGGLGQGTEEGFCFPFFAENECGSVLEGSVFDEEEQEARFNAISLTISDARMAPPECRRPLIWLLCTVVFGDCQNSSSYSSSSSSSSSSFSSSSPSLLDSEEAMAICDEVSDNCGGNGVNCSLLSFFFPSSSSPTSSRTINEDFSLSRSSFDLYDEPIPVITCINEDREEIECCFDPYSFDSYQECVIACAPPYFTEYHDKIFLIMMYIYLWLTTLAVFFCVIPLFVTPGALEFPKYCLPLSIVLFVVFIQIHAWAFFVWPDNYLCNGYDGFAEAFDAMVDSTICKVQAILFYFFIILSEFWLTIMAMCLTQIALSQSSKPDRLSAFLANLFQRKRTEVSLHLLGFTLAFVVSVVSVLLADSDGLLTLDGPFRACSIYPQGVGLTPYIVISILLGLTTFFIIFNTYSLVQRSWVFLRIHIRIFLFLLMMVNLFLSFTIYVFVFINQIQYYERLTDYATCVLTHPRSESSGCELENSDLFGVYLWVYTVVHLTIFFVCVVVYMTNPLLYSWWKTLILKRKILTFGTREGSVNSKLSNSNLND